MAGQMPRKTRFRARPRALSRVFTNERAKGFTELPGINHLGYRRQTEPKDPQA